MKTIGLIGGMSWESTVIYYQKINTYVKNILGNEHSAKILMYAYDYHELEVLLEKGDWQAIETSLIDKAKKLEAMGAELLLICANTMHIAAAALENSLSIPLVHIVKATRNMAKNHKMKRVLLLGTMYTMQSKMYPELFEASKIEVITPSQRDQAYIHRVIYHELIKGQFLDSSKQKMIAIINKEQIDGVILGCTEIPLLIHQKDISVPLLDTLDIHAQYAVFSALDKIDPKTFNER